MFPIGSHPCTVQTYLIEHTYPSLLTIPICSIPLTKGQKQPLHQCPFQKPVLTFFFFLWQQQSFPSWLICFVWHLCMNFSKTNTIKSNRHLKMIHVWAQMEEPSLFSPGSSFWRGGFVVIPSTSKCICTWHTHTSTHRHAHTCTIPKHSLMAKHTQATSDRFQLNRGLGGHEHLAVPLHQRTTIRDLRMQNPDSRIDRHLRPGKHIIPTYWSEIVAEGIEFPVITTVATCNGSVYVITFLFASNDWFIWNPMINPGKLICLKTCVTFSKVDIFRNM